MMSERTYQTKLMPLLRRLCAAELDGIIANVQCWSPADTLADTRFVWDGHDPVFYAEAEGIITGMGY